MSGGKGGDLMRSQSILLAHRDFGFWILLDTTSAVPRTLPYPSDPTDALICKSYSIHLCDKNPYPSNVNVQKTKNIVHNMADSRLCCEKGVATHGSSYCAFTAFGGARTDGRRHHRLLERQKIRRSHNISTFNQ